MIGNIGKLQDNYWQVVKIAISLENRLKKADLSSTYNAEFSALLTRGTLNEISSEEIDEWQKTGGKINYISHHAVMKSSSDTTPLRIVWNSSLKNNYSGVSCNDLWPKGSNSLNNLFNVLINWRFYTYALVWDLSKAYNAMYTGKQEQFLRLSVWRDSKTDKPFKTYGAQRVMFGDKPAANVLEYAKILAADKGQLIDKVAAIKIVNDSYVDDSLSGANTLEEVLRLKGSQKVDSLGKCTYDGTVQEILLQAGFSVKVMVQSGETNAVVIKKLGKTILGHIWDPKDDCVGFKYIFNPKLKTNRLKGSNNDEDISLVAMSKIVYTPRIALSMVNSFYDPAGLCAPFLAKYKIALREITIIGYEWDQPLNPKMQIKWQQLAKELITLEKIQFPRSVRPKNAIGQPSLIGFWDGADAAFLGKVYARWNLEDGSVESRLIACKVRIVPSKGITTPRAELCGLLILSRLLNVIINSMQVLPESITCLGDSECTIACLEAKTSVMAPYFANRIAEILDLREKWTTKGITVNPLSWIAGKDNPADQGTRDDVVATDITLGTVHQVGTSWMSKPYPDWPTSRTFLTNTPIVPKEEMRQKYQGLYNSVMTTTDNSWMYFSNRLIVIQGIAARLTKVLRTGRRHSIAEELTPADYKAGNYLLQLLSMDGTRKLFASKDMSGLASYEEQGILYTRGRLGNNLSHVLGLEKLPILAYNSRLAWLIMKYCHNEDHRSDPADALFRSRKHAWIVKGRTLAKSITVTCKWCKLLATNLNKATSSQIMGTLPRFKLTVQKPFSNIAIDFLGLFTVKAMNNARSYLKVYPVVYCCMITGAIQIRISHAYSTDAFMLQYAGHCALRGHPTTIYTDCGSQLVKASSIDNPNMNWEEIKSKSVKNGTEWKFAPPGCQFRNGLAESRVKAIKRTLQHLKEGTGMNFAQIQVLMERIANIINERPLGVQYINKSVGEFQPITPNMLILGHSDKTTSNSDETVNINYKRSLNLIEQIESHWWRKWSSQIFPHLLTIKKWNTRQRNLKIGDICMLKSDSRFPPKKGDFKICRVSKVFYDNEKIVRTVYVQIAKKNLNTVTGYELTETRTAIQRLIVICPVDEADDQKELAHAGSTYTLPHGRSTKDKSKDL
jgi:hypothetical protein